jgi:hypothetical protein
MVETAMADHAHVRGHAGSKPIPTHPMLDVFPTPGFVAFSTFGHGLVELTGMASLAVSLAALIHEST